MIKTKNFSGELILRDRKRLLISVSSLGYAKAERYHQFWKYAANSGASTLFLADRSLEWYNNSETETVFATVDRIARDFDEVALIGDSMGGSGAILLSNYVRHAKRVLTFAPQFSVSRPFIDFDTRYLKRAAAIKHVYFDNYAYRSPDCDYFLLYGNTIWQDHIHRSMFETFGFKTLTVAGAPHPVAMHLAEKSPATLQSLISTLCDFTADYTEKSLSAILTEFQREKVRLRKLPITLKGERMPPPLPAPKPRAAACIHEVSLRKPSSQSSIGAYSVGKTIAEDAARANCGEIMRPYACHTTNQEDPWWSVNLEGATLLSHVEIYNRCEKESVRERADQLQIEIKRSAGSDWEVVYTKLTRTAIDDASGAPFVWIPDEEITASELRVKLIGKKSLHFRMVSVFGKPLP